MSDWTDLQEDIISEHKRDESQSDEEIAVEVDCSASYVNTTRKEFAEQEGGNESGGKGLILLLIVFVILGLAAASGDGSAASMSVVLFCSFDIYGYILQTG